MIIDIKNFKEKLEKELESLEKELSEVARRNPDSPTDWEAIPAERDASQADDNTVADSVDDYEDNNAIVNQLEPKYRDVLDALDKITKGTYGLCEVCGKEIELERLEANPAARTCREHMK